MKDRSTASVGVVLAAIALAGAALPWGTVGVGPVENVVLAVLGVAAFGAFSLRKNGLLDREPGALLAGTASFAVVGYVVLVLSGVVAVGPPSPSPWGLSFAVLGGVGGVIAAYGDGRGFPENLKAGAVATGKSLLLGFSGLFAIAVWANIVVVVGNMLVPGGLPQMLMLAVSAIALGLGTGTIAVVYFVATDKSLSYLDFRIPNLKGFGWTVAGIFALFALNIAVSFVLSQIGVGTASHSIEQSARDGDPTILLWLIPAAFLIIGPGEELLYRNIIQKSLYDTFSKWGAVVVASVVFALAHIPAYAAGASSVSALLSTLSVIFLLSMVLGTVYLKTENTTVSALIHGAFDAILFAAMYVQITGTTTAAILP
ncbi:CPBP family intramembrane glutamic endopeptidase [Halorussus halophilus]|uniref:CPBP family intramembrane glutamic endopeptidase n=1 Tax=Halorussus halophilus TaxID=2650975 RepID=UPI001301139F|nr:CPBP family intramembrane glutamic endopeptidase [Halorussus halophilus]